MKIQVRKGIGTGPTELAAFDQALVNAGVANFNLIYLSSVIPESSQIIVEQAADPTDGKWGDRLYVVIAQSRTSLPNQEVWAGIGWMQDESGKGMLVEHEGHSEAEVRADIDSSLKALEKNRGVQFRKTNMEIAGTKCDSLPVCAVVVVVFESSSWKN